MSIKVNTSGSPPRARPGNVSNVNRQGKELTPGPGWGEPLPRPAPSHRQSAHCRCGVRGVPHQLISADASTPIAHRQARNVARRPRQLRRIDMSAGRRSSPLIMCPVVVPWQMQKVLISCLSMWRIFRQGTAMMTKPGSIPRPGLPSQGSQSVPPIYIARGVPVSWLFSPRVRSMLFTVTKKENYYQYASD